MDYSTATKTEINAAVARKLGWVQCCNPGTMENGKIVDCFGWSKGGSHFHAPYPDYCGSIAAAFEVVEHCKSIGLEVDICFLHSWGDGSLAHWQARFWKFKPDDVEAMESAPTPAMAICLAFLKLP